MSVNETLMKCKTYTLHLAGHQEMVHHGHLSREQLQGAPCGPKLLLLNQISSSCVLAGSNHKANLASSQLLPVTAPIGLQAMSQEHTAQYHAQLWWAHTGGSLGFSVASMHRTELDPGAIS